MVCVNIIHTKLYIPNDCSATGDLSFLFGSTYGLRLMSYGHEMVPEYARCFQSSICLASVYIFHVCMYSQATCRHWTTFAIELSTINSRNLVEEGAADSASSAQVVLLPALGVLASIIMAMIIVSSICCHAGLQYWWILMATGVHCQDLIVTCGRPWMADSVAEALGHEESSGGRNVTGAHRSAMGNKKV